MKFVKKGGGVAMTSLSEKLPPLPFIVNIAVERHQRAVFLKSFDIFEFEGYGICNGVCEKGWGKQLH